MSKWTDQELDSLIEEVMRRAIVDPEFRKIAVNSPSEALAKFAAKPLPIDLTIRFADNDAGTRTFVLPAALPGTGELSEAELEHVAGGCGMSCICTNSCCYTCHSSSGEE